MTNHYRTEAEIDAVVLGFEECTTGKNDFTHLSHLTVAVYYLRNSTLDEAFQKMSTGLFRFLDHHGVEPTKYKAQLTRAWLVLVQGLIDQLDPKLSLVTTTNIVLDRLSSSRIEIDDQP